MARNSSDREDLMAEAIALSPRISISIPQLANEIIAGERSDGRWSIYFNGDPVYHFDSKGRLRRAFVDGSLYRSQGTTLSRLDRQTQTNQTILLRHDLNQEELIQFRAEMHARFTQTLLSISRENYQIIRMIPDLEDYLPRLLEAIQRVLSNGFPLSPSLK